MSLFRTYTLPFGAQRPDRPVAGKEDAIRWYEKDERGLYHAVSIDRTQASLVDFQIKHDDEGSRQSLRIVWRDGTTNLIFWEVGTGRCFSALGYR